MYMHAFTLGMNSTKIEKPLCLYLFDILIFHNDDILSMFTIDTKIHFEQSNRMNEAICFLGRNIMQ